MANLDPTKSYETVKQTVRFILFAVLLSYLVTILNGHILTKTRDRDLERRKELYLNYKRNNYKNFPRAEKHRTVIVHLNNWTYTDIKAECEKFLGPEGFAAVQISPVTAHAIPKDGNSVTDERLSVANYRIKNDSGDANQLKEMIEACNRVKVRVIIEVVLNNMMRDNDINPCRENPTHVAKKYGECNEPEMFLPKHFNNELFDITDRDYMSDINKVRTGLLGGRHDLKQLLPNEKGVPNKYMYGLLYRLISMGAAGFKIVNADHMFPEHLVKLYDTLPDLLFEETPTRPFIYSDVYDPLKGTASASWVIKDADYVTYTRVTDYKYAADLARIFKNHRPLTDFQNWREHAKQLPKDDNSVVFTHTPMTQVYGSSGSTPYPTINPKFIDPLYKSYEKAFKLATGFMLSHKHGIPVITTRHTSKKGYDHNSGTALEHREVLPMIKWRNNVIEENANEFPEVNNFQVVSDEGNQVGYCVGNVGFVVFNNQIQEITLDTSFLTCFDKPGIYCDLYSGGLKAEKDRGRELKVEDLCVGKGINVDSNKKAMFSLEYWEGLQLYNTKQAYFFEKKTK